MIFNCMYVKINDVKRKEVCDMAKKKQLKVTVTDIILMASVLAVGCFHEFISCILSVAISVIFAIKVIKNGEISIKINPVSIFAAALCLMYGLTVFWAVDSGMAFVGFLKFLPLILFLLLSWQDTNSHLEEILPSFATAATLISMLLMTVETYPPRFSVAGRMAGFFQYPNAFAAFLLVSELLIIKKGKFKFTDFCNIAVLITGILLTGSRIVFVLALASNFLMILLNLKKKPRLIALGVSGAVLFGVVIVAAIGDNIFSRYLSISLRESTFVGRMLYIVDALPLLLKNPFGMGYLGYYYKRGAIQTGVYSVKYIHNDFMQVFLDTGWLVGLLFIAAIIMFVIKKGTPIYKKIIVLTLCAHSLLDFDLQFISMFMLLLALMDGEYTETKQIKLKSAVCISVSSLLVAVNLYMGIALSLSHFTKREAADKMYPYNTENKISMIRIEKDYAKASALADEILRQNTDSYIAYATKAKYEYSIGNFEGLIKNQNIALQKAPFEYDQYKKYFKMLIEGIELYKNGNTDNAEICREELIKVKRKFDSVTDNLSVLGALIDDQFETELPEETREYINQLVAEK